MEAQAARLFVVETDPPEGSRDAARRRLAELDRLIDIIGHTTDPVLADVAGRLRDYASRLRATAPRAGSPDSSPPGG